MEVGCNGFEMTKRSSEFRGTLDEKVQFFQPVGKGHG